MRKLKLSSMLLGLGLGLSSFAYASNNDAIKNMKIDGSTIYGVNAESDLLIYDAALDDWTKIASEKKVNNYDLLVYKKYYGHIGATDYSTSAFIFTDDGDVASYSTGKKQWENNYLSEYFPLNKYYITSDVYISGAIDDNITGAVSFVATEEGIYIRYRLRPSEYDSDYGLDKLTNAQFTSPVISMLYNYRGSEKFAGGKNFPISILMILKNGAVYEVALPQTANAFYANPDVAKNLPVKNLSLPKVGFEKSVSKTYGDVIKGLVTVANDGKVNFLDINEAKQTSFQLDVEGSSDDRMDIITTPSSSEDVSNDSLEFLVQNITKSKDVYIYDMASCNEAIEGDDHCLKMLSHNNGANVTAVLQDGIFLGGAVVGFDNGHVEVYDKSSNRWTPIRYASSAVTKIEKYDNNSILVAFESGRVDRINSQRQIFTIRYPTKSFYTDITANTDNYSASLNVNVGTYDKIRPENSQYLLKVTNDNGDLIYQHNLSYGDNVVNIDDLESNTSYIATVTATGDSYNSLESTEEFKTEAGNPQHKLAFVIDDVIDKSYTSAVLKVNAIALDLSTTKDLKYTYSIVDNETDKVIKTDEVDDNGAIATANQIVLGASGPGGSGSLSSYLKANHSYTLTLTASAYGFPPVVEEIPFDTISYKINWTNRGSPSLPGTTSMNVKVKGEFDSNDPSTDTTGMQEHVKIYEKANPTNVIKDDYGTWKWNPNTPNITGLEPGTEYTFEYAILLDRYSGVPIKFDFTTSPS